MTEYAPSASTALFKESAQKLVKRLEEDDGSREAYDMARLARELVQVFEVWQTVRPDDDERVARIQQLFDLNRRAMEYLSASAPPAVSSSRR